MYLRPTCALLILAGLSGCTSSGVGGLNGNGSNPTPLNVTRVYNGTASVGDFLTITLDTGAKTIAYTDISNGASGTVPYTVNADGSYTLNDPAGNLIAAYEVPDYALVIEAAKAGPSQNTPALITAVESGPISISTFANRSYNYMQFRTASGGLEVGSVTIGATTGQNTSYWPYGALNPQENETFHNSSIESGQAQEDSSGTFLKMPEPQGSGYDYLFGTANGFFIVDMSNGSLLGLQKAASKDFNPAVAGSYNAIFYQKTGAATGQGDVETGTPSLGKATIVVSASGGVTITDSQGNVLTPAGTTLTPVADTSYLYGADGQLADPCWGLFTFRIVAGGTQQDVFVTFINNAVVFSAFKAAYPWSTASGTYDYLYGVGLK